MTRLLVLLAVAVLGCNSIVGVSEMRLKKQSTQVDDDESDDDDDRTPDDTPVAARDAGTTGVPECNGAPDCERMVFVTKAKFTGKLGGLSGADQICFEAAKRIPSRSGRAFRAWLSDSTMDAADRIPHGTKPYRRTDGSVFATSWADLADGSLNLPLALDEEGNELTGSSFDKSVWTGTSPAGLYNDSSCSDWVAETVTASGSFGESEATTVEWTEVPGEPIAESSCNAQKHIYCIEY